MSKDSMTLHSMRAPLTSSSIYICVLRNTQLPAKSHSCTLHAPIQIFPFPSASYRPTHTNPLPCGAISRRGRGGGEPPHSLAPGSSISLPPLLPLLLLSSPNPMRARMRVRACVRVHACVRARALAHVCKQTQPRRPASLLYAHLSMNLLSLNPSAPSLLFTFPAPFFIITMPPTAS